MKRYMLAITGASGSILGLRLLEALINLAEVHLILSEAALPIIKEETGIDLTVDPKGRLTEILIKRGIARKNFFKERLFLYNDNNLWVPLSSGSFLSDGMFVVPCSMKTLSAIAHGYADSLIMRTADVTLKEGRPLVLVPRETPLNAVHLENMLKLARIGVRIVPPVFGFYYRPKNIDEMVDFITGKILDQLRIEHNLYERWQ